MSVKNKFSVKLKLSRALTLIEVMFVIIIIAVISVASVSVMQQRVINQSANQTAATLMRWIQASQNYYTANLYWPQITNNDGGWSDLHNPGFLSTADQCSKITQPTSTGAPTANCGNFGSFTIAYATGNDSNGQPFTYKTAPYLSISTPVSNQALAQQIVAKLPNAQWIPGTNGQAGQVVAYALVPGSYQLPNQYKIMVRGKVVATPSSWPNGYQDTWVTDSTVYYQMYGSSLQDDAEPVNTLLVMYGLGGSELNLIFSNGLPSPKQSHVPVNTGIACAYYPAYQYWNINSFSGVTAACQYCASTNVGGKALKTPNCTFPRLATPSSWKAIEFNNTPPSTGTAGALGDSILKTLSNDDKPLCQCNGYTTAAGYSGANLLNIYNTTTGPYATNLNVTMSAGSQCYLGNTRSEVSTDGGQPFPAQPQAYSNFLSNKTSFAIAPESSLQSTLQAQSAGFPYWAFSLTTPGINGLVIYTASDVGGACQININLNWTDPVKGQCYQASYLYSLNAQVIVDEAIYYKEPSNYTNAAAFNQAMLYQTQEPKVVNCPS